MMEISIFGKQISDGGVRNYSNAIILPHHVLSYSYINFYSYSYY